MKHDKHISERQGLVREKQIWMIATILSLVINVGLVIGLLAKKHTIQTTFLPPEINNPFTYTNGQYSREYVEQVSTWFLTLVLNYTPASFKYQMLTFSKHIDPALYSKMREILSNELKDIIKQSRSSTFFIQRVSIVGLNAMVTGIRSITVGKTTATEEIENWYVKLSKRSDGLVTLADFKKMSNADVIAFRKGAIQPQAEQQ
jgi:type IV conjugative transfer system protein TraE